MAFRCSLLTLDALAVLGSLTLAYVLRISSGLLAYNAPYNEALYYAFSLVSVPIWLALFAALGLYQRDILLGGVTEYQRIINACTGGVIALIVLSFMWRSSSVSRGWLLLSWGLSCALVGLERFSMRHLAYRLRRRGWFTARVLVAGANEQGIAIARQWLHAPTSGMQVLGFVDDFKPLGTPVLNGLKVLGRPTSLGELAHQMGVNEVVVVPNAVAWETFEEIVARASSPNGFTVRLSPGFYGMLTTNVAVSNKTFVPLFTINETRIVGVEAMLKVLLDYGLGAPLLLLASPLMVLIAAGLKLVNGGEPILARYQTMGQSGAIFSMFKFRLRIGLAGKATHQGNATKPAWSSISWLERTLYRTGLDKLPQLFNVLAGQMSLVGPRPHVVGEETDPLMVRNLQTVKPGMIGPWMVGEYWTSPDEVQNDLYYVRNWTIWLDLQILAQAALSFITAGLLIRPIPIWKGQSRPSVRPFGVPSHQGRKPTRPTYAPLLSQLGGTGNRVYRHYDTHHNVGNRL